MDEFQTEEEQIAAIKKWWSENGFFVIGGVSLGLAALFGFRWMEAREEAQLQQASSTYESVLEAVQDSQRDRAQNLAGELESEHSDSEYTAQAALALAKVYVEADEPAEAVTQLEKAIAVTSDEQLRATARLRLARVLLHQAKAQRALDTLDVGGAGAFQPFFDEVRGDALVVLGRESEARDAYRNALDAFPTGLGDRRMVEMKLSAITTTEDEVSNES